MRYTNGISVSVPLLVSESHLQAAAGVGSRSAHAGRRGWGEQHLRRRRLPGPRLPSAAQVRAGPVRRRRRRIMGQVRATGPRAGQEVRGCGGPPASRVLPPLRRFSPRPVPSPQSELETLGEDPDPDSEGGRGPRAAPFPRVAPGCAYMDAPWWSGAPCMGLRFTSSLGSTLSPVPPTQETEE